MLFGGDLDEMIGFQRGKLRSKRVQKMRGTIWQKVTIFKLEICVRDLTLLQHLMRSGLHHLIEKWGDDLAKNADFQTRRFNLVCHVIFFRAARGLYHLIILTKMTILKRATNACLQTYAWRRIYQKWQFEFYAPILCMVSK